MGLSLHPIDEKRRVLSILKKKKKIREDTPFPQKMEQTVRGQTPFVSVPFGV